MAIQPWSLALDRDSHRQHRLFEALVEEGREPEKLIDDARREGVNPAAIATACFWAGSVQQNPEQQRRLIYSYLKLHTASALDEEPDSSLADLLGVAARQPNPERDRDIALSALRALSLDDSWYVGSRCGETVLAWLTEQWNQLVHASNRSKSIGMAGAAALGYLADATAQIERSLREAEKAVVSADAQGLSTVIRNVLDGLNKGMAFVLREESSYTRAHLQRLSHIASGFSNHRSGGSIFDSADEAYEAIEDIEGRKQELIEFAESPTVNALIEFDEMLLQRFKSELARWGDLRPQLSIKSERLTYTFRDGAAEVHLMIRNDGLVSIDQGNILLGATADGATLPDSCVTPSMLTLPLLGPGEEFDQPVYLSIPSSAVRLRFEWFGADIASRHGDAGLQEGDFDIEVDQGIDWKAVAIAPFPYSTAPVEDPTRLFGRDDDLATLLRAIRSGESRYLTGQRRVGKTSLLNVLFDQLETEEFLPVLTSWGEIGADSESMFARVCFHLCQRMEASTRRLLQDSTGLDCPSYDQFQTSFNAATTEYVRRLTRQTKRRLVIGLDDFDDVPDWVYSGEQGELFFAMIKSLTGNPGVSLVFVGGQRLQRIMRSNVAARLNQVTAVSLDYLERDELKALVEGPSAGVLRFEPEAVNQIAYWSAGNPFYCNRICNALWDLMIREQHSHVIASDVDRAVHDAAGKDDTNVFFHFWADGIGGDGSPDAQARWEMMNKLVLWAVGRLQASSPSTEYQSLDGIAKEAKLPDAEARRTVSDLVTRQVLMEHGTEPDRYRTLVPYFQHWLSRRGASDLYAQLDTSVLRDMPPMVGITDTEIEELFPSAHLRYRSGIVGPYEVRKFLDQFGGLDHQRLIFPLIRRLLTDGFISEEEMRKAANSAALQLRRLATSNDPNFRSVLSRDDQWTNVFLVVPDNEIDSSAAVGDVVRQTMGLSKLQAGNIDKLIHFLLAQPTTSAVLVFDDIIGTGKTASSRASRVLQALDEHDLASKASAVLFFAAAGFKDVLDELNSSFRGRVTFLAERTLFYSDQAFDTRSGIYDSDEEREAARKLVESFGEKLEKRFPLGFGSREALVASYRNTPNITLPIFWKYSRKTGSYWTPLLRRMT